MKTSYNPATISQIANTINENLKEQGYPQEIGFGAITNSSGNGAQASTETVGQKPAQLSFDDEFKSIVSGIECKDPALLNAVNAKLKALAPDAPWTVKHFSIDAPSYRGNGPYDITIQGLKALVSKE